MDGGEGEDGGEDEAKLGGRRPATGERAVVPGMPGRSCPAAAAAAAARAARAVLSSSGALECAWCAQPRPRAQVQNPGAWSRNLIFLFRWPSKTCSLAAGRVVSSSGLQGDYSASDARGRQAQAVMHPSHD